MKRILIATDGSPSAQEAVDLGLALAQEQGAAVTFVHVAPADEVRGGRGGTHPFTHGDEVNESEIALRSAASAAEAADVPYALEHFSGEPVETIGAFAESEGIDLIVVGNRGRNAVSSALLGSISHGLVRHATRPVLVVKGAKTPVETPA
jgi:nucleotide-binding universal stress UspA family protein